MTAYDSGPDTIRHIARVRELLTEVRRNIADRMLDHDFSKLGPEEKPHFDAIGPNIRDIPYPSPEYDQALDDLDTGLIHHWRHNTHHPEFYSPVIRAEDATRDVISADVADGHAIASMSLVDLIELICDWKAAGERHANGSFGHSLVSNRERFGIDYQLFSILVATGVELGYLPEGWTAP